MRGGPSRAGGRQQGVTFFSCSNNETGRAAQPPTSDTSNYKM